MVDWIACKICDSKTASILGIQILKQYEGRIQSCSNCGFQFVENPTWLADSFKSSLNQFDVGSADRSLIVAGFVRSIFSRKKASEVKVLDFGGGDGFGEFLLDARDFFFGFFYFGKIYSLYNYI